MKKHNTYIPVGDFVRPDGEKFSLSVLPLHLVSTDVELRYSIKAEHKVWSELNFHAVVDRSIYQDKNTADRAVACDGVNTVKQFLMEATSTDGGNFAVVSPVNGLSIQPS